MENGKPISDLQRVIETEKVVIVQSQKLTAEFYASLKEKKFNGVADDVFRGIFDSILDLHLAHVGFLACDNQHSNEPGTPFHFISCGGILTITAEMPDADFSWLKSPERGNLFITCSNPACKMTLASNRELSELQNILFHLMLKQMFPTLNFCNYVACDQKRDNLVREEDYPKEIQELGMVAVASEILSGIINNGYFSKRREQYSFGFMLMPGMNTLYGFGGFDGWARFLISKKMEQLADIEKSMRSKILGPKPAKKS